MAKEIATPDPVALYATQAVRRVGTVVADMNADAPTIRISGPMYSDMEGASSEFMEALDGLKSIGATEANLEINSGGGSITEGIAIHDAIAASGIEFDCFIFGICASAATLPAMACRSITIAKNARFMIHEARSGSYGTADDLEEVAAWLRRMNDTAIAAYVARTGRTEEDVRALAKDETWYHSGQEAVDAGWADRVLDVEAVAEVTEAELRAFDNAPEDLREARADPRATRDHPRGRTPRRARRRCGRLRHLSRRERRGFRGLRDDGRLDRRLYHGLQPALRVHLRHHLVPVHGTAGHGHRGALRGQPAASSVHRGELDCGATA